VHEMLIALIVDWYGPFVDVKLASTKISEYGLQEGLYLATGKRKGEHKRRLQYVGISQDIKDRINPKTHHRLKFITRDLRLWVGEVASHAVAGRRRAGHAVAHSVAVELAEWATAYFLALPLNKKKRDNPPPRSLILVNRWFQTDFETPRRQRGHLDWVDYIEYDPEYHDGGAKVVSFRAPGRKHYTRDEVQALTKVRRVDVPADPTKNKRAL
jgi:hypothetical protein